MEQNKSPFEQWESGVGLGGAWWAFASAESRTRIRELQRKGEHLGLQASLEDDLIARISAGELRAFGFEGGSDAGPTLISQRYFWRTEEIDWDRETVQALGKKFYHVTIQGEREPEYPWTPEPIDPLLIHREPESPDEALPGLSEPSSDPLAQTKPEVADEKRQTPRMGRPLLLPEVRKVVRKLIDRHSFANLSKKQIETLIRLEAKELSPASFPKSGQPSKNTINKALRLEGWPPPPAK
jgi:hypothetical protein